MSEEQRTVVVSCETLRDEIADSMERTGRRYPVRWLDSGLHNVPSRLHTELQEVLAGIEPGSVDRVIFFFGNCGNAVQGLATGPYELVMPRLDDCLTLLLGSQRRRTALNDELHAIYLTEGWMRSRYNLNAEYERTAAKHGEEAAQAVFDMMYGHYQTLALIDDGTYPIEDLKRETALIAQRAKLIQTVVPGTLDYVDQLLTGPWDENRFLVMPPNSVIPSDARIFAQEAER